MEAVRLRHPRRPGGPRVLHGHPWVYRNEIAGRGPHLQPGTLVEVVDWQGRFVGRGYANPLSEITVRLLTREPEAIDEAFIRRRLDHAITLRRQWFPPDPDKTQAVRLVFSEADGLPGLIVDRYGEALVVQIMTAGMEALKSLICTALMDLMKPTAIMERSNLPVRQLEGLTLTKGALYGSVQGPVEVEQHRLIFSVDLMDGQKTGLYLDQAENYAAARGLVPRLGNTARVLDVFCYLGAWGVHAAAAGAHTVEGLDSSVKAVEKANAGAERNGVAGRCRFRVADAFEDLSRLEEAGARYDLIILDPPSFVRNRARVSDALRGHKELHLRAFRLLAPGGVLITCCCSHLVGREPFETTIADAAHDTRRTVRLLERRGQAKDHPVVFGIPETAYLQCVIVQAL